METIGERLSILIKRLNLTAEKFAIEIGEDKGSVSKWINNKVKPGYDALSKIVEKFQNVDSKWLLGGEGNIFILSEYQVPNADNTISEPLLTINMQTEIEFLRAQVAELSATIRDQAASLRDYAAAEKDNARSRVHLTETVVTQAQAIANLTSGKAGLKKASGGV